ncbi:MAG: hypothetical protein JRE13_10040, partial [Deltaproteobacteria bacterium]|nr:hypothetical protein [Deltaproteobacteria bacterium]
MFGTRSTPRIPSTPRSTALAALALALLFPGPDGRASDTDLFRVSVPPNILLMVDNSSSMSNQVWHSDFNSLIVESGVTKPASEQTECEYFRNTVGVGKYKIYITAKRFSYKDTNGRTMRYRSGTDKWWELLFPIMHPDGSEMYNDIDADGVQDAGEEDLYYRFPDPTQSDTNWNNQTNSEMKPVVDWQGNHLWYDADGDGIQEAGDRDLYYHLKASNAIRGTAAKIVSRITSVGEALAARIDPMTLEIQNSDICGTDATGWSLWDGNDPLAATPGGKVMNISGEYLDFLFSSFGATARAGTFAPTVGNDGIRTKTDCVTLIGSETSTYETYRRSRIQALTLILRTVICEVNQVGNVRFGFAQFRFAGKSGDDNGGYVAVPIEDWFESDGVTQKTYSLHGSTDTHENHLRRVIRTSAPDAQTPLAESMFQLYSYFMSREVDELPEGRDWEGNTTGVTFPVYNYDMSLYDALAGYDADVDSFPPNLEDVGGRYVGPVPL